MAAEITDLEWYSDPVSLSEIDYVDGYLVDRQGRKVASIGWGMDTTDFLPEVDDLHGRAIARACRFHDALVELAEMLSVLGPPEVRVRVDRLLKRAKGDA